MHGLLRKFEIYLLTEKRVAFNTYKAYSADCMQYAIFLEKCSLTLEESSESTLRDFLTYLHTTGIHAKTVCRKIAALKLFFKFCNEKHDFENKAKSLIFPQTESTLPLYCSEKDIHLLLDTCRASNAPKNSRTYIQLLLLYNSGMRVSELCGIGLSDIDWHTGTIRITGKGSKMRIVPMPQTVMHELKKYIEAHAPSGYLFPVLYNKRIKPISRQTVYTSCKKMVKEAALKHAISPHTFRHSLATHLLKYGWDLRSLQLLLGHEQITTVQLYTHLEKSDLQAMYNKKHPRA